MEQTLLSNINSGQLPHPLRLFWRSELFDEVVLLENMLFPDMPVPRKEAASESEAWDQIIADLLRQIPAFATEIGDLKLVALRRSDDAKSLRWRLRQTLQALGPLPRLGTKAHPPAGVLPSHQVLLPMLLKARLLFLLGSATLPMAWVRTIDLSAMPAPQTRPDRPE